MVEIGAIEASIRDNGQLFFRHLSSRKPYKITPLLIVNRFDRASYGKILPFSGVNVKVAFSSGNTEIVSSYFLYKTWYEAERVAPVREEKRKGKHFKEISQGKSKKRIG